MDLVHADITLRNPAKNIEIKVKSMVDSGALLLCIPEHLALQLELPELEKREVVLANGHRATCAYVGPIEVRFESRRCFVGALVLGDEPLLGAVPMEDMDVLIHPAKRQLIVNPDSPTMPVALVKKSS